jgi:hypothetical protein
VAILSAVSDALTALPDLPPLAWQNPAQAYEGPRVEVTLGLARPITLGPSGGALYNGQIRIVIVVHEGEGSVPAEMIAHSVAAAFPIGARVGPAIVTGGADIPGGYPDSHVGFRVPVNIPIRFHAS